MGWVDQVNETAQWKRLLVSLALGPVVHILAFLIPALGILAAIYFYGLGSDLARGDDFMASVFINNIGALLAFVVILGSLMFLGSYVVGRIARSFELSLPIWSATVLTLVLAFISVPPAPVFTWIIFIGMMLVPAVPGGWLARRHRLRQAARADQAIIDTF